MQIIVETADWDDFGGHWVEAGFDKFEIRLLPIIIGYFSVFVFTINLIGFINIYNFFNNFIL